MPVLDGYAATQEIRRREEAAGQPRVPLVAMTADAMPSDRERCLAAGMDDYLAKPITSGEVDGVLERWLGDAPKLASSPLDADRLHELHELFPGAEAMEMLAGLERDVGSQLDRITGALQRRDPTVISYAVHRVPNCARILGANELAEAAATLEAVSDERSAAFNAAQLLTGRWRPVYEALAAERRATPDATRP